MLDPSSPVTSRQTGPHPRLAETVLKHASHPWRKPVARYSLEAFQVLAPVVEAWLGPLILDTGCGTGQSTRVLARRNPEALVLGIDKSLARLGRGSGDLPPNARLVRFDLEDLWPLAHQAGWRFARQCFFYPNPWPKPEQRLRRWAFHPVLPVALACGGTWEVRSNWDVYAQEFAVAFGLLAGITPRVEPWNPPEPETLFEKKYQDSGHSLWRWEAQAPVSEEPRSGLRGRPG
jgi:tRNA G46 methylase TrmB